LIGKRALAYHRVVADVFHALDDETRRLVLDGLVARDGQTLFEICSLLTMRHGVTLTRQAISQHLGVLEAAGLITTQRRGRSKFHYFNPEPLAGITQRWLSAEQRSDP
jgi:DNA-binding transcriptional ArsR family regulator